MQALALEYMARKEGAAKIVAAWGRCQHGEVRSLCKDCCGEGICENAD